MTQPILPGWTTPMLWVGLLLGSPGAWAADGAAIATQGSAAGAPACIGCHGPNGEGIAAAGFPRLAGLPHDYLRAQIQAFRDGARTHPVMDPIAKALQPDEANAVSGYYSQLPPPSAAPSTADAATLALGKTLARYGDWTGRRLPACQQCHAPLGRGVGSSFPPLAAQGASYIVNQLKGFAAGQRQGDPIGVMRAVAQKLTEQEMAAVAAWYQALPGDGPLPDTLASIEVLALAPAAASPATGGDRFAAPPLDAYPDGPFGQAVRRGEAIFRHTNSDPVSAAYVGNDQQCANCHLGRGRLAGSAPLWAAWVAYPAWRGKNQRVNSFLDRVQGCFTYSMNARASQRGQAPALDSPVLIDLESYAYWLASGAPAGDAKMAGRGFPPLALPQQGYSPARGAKVYAERCAFCHGADGQGASAGNQVVLPPLWGARAYNWGAGMHQVDKAAAFIKANMPLGLSNNLSDQQAWDVAAYINSFERPQDPRFDGDLAATAERFHAKHQGYYGKPAPAGGSPLGGSAPPRPGD